jgi:hypothetical protein
MSETDPSGYDDSPDTTDTSVGAESDTEGAATLTTDDDAQRDSVERPGNEPD